MKVTQSGRQTVRRLIIFRHTCTPAILFLAYSYAGPSNFWCFGQIFWRIICYSTPVSTRSQSRKEMWLTGEKYDWLATWSRLEKAKWLTDDLSQNDWRRRRYDDFSQHRRRLQRSPSPLAEFEGMWRGKGKERRGKKMKDGKGRKSRGKGKGMEEKGRGNGRGSEGKDGTQLFDTKWRQCQPVIYIREE